MNLHFSLKNEFLQIKFRKKIIKNKLSTENKDLQLHSRNKNENESKHKILFSEFSINKYEDMDTHYANARKLNF